MAQSSRFNYNAEYATVQDGLNGGLIIDMSDNKTKSWWDYINAYQASDVSYHREQAGIIRRQFPNPQGMPTLEVVPYAR